MNYKKSQYLRVEKLIKNGVIFNNDPGNGMFKKKSYPFILKDSSNNLLSQYKDTILEYFDKNEIAWWNGKLTNHPLSSQAACINHLFPIRNDKVAVLSVIKGVCPDIVDVLPITSDKYLPAYIQLESVSDADHLNELSSTRGSNCTSIDALIMGVHRDGRKILFPIEWKYVESYGNDDKAKGDKGVTRLSRYTDLINNSSQLKSISHKVYYFEPFYQLMRQTLWAEQMVAHNDSETIKADDFIHIHVIPTDNVDLLKKVYPYSGLDMERTWRSHLKDQSKYKIVDPKVFLSPILSHPYHDLIQYLDTRYWL